MAESNTGSGDRIFKATLIVLLFFFNLLHWGMFIGCRYVLIPSLTCWIGFTFKKTVFYSIEGREDARGKKLGMF